MKITIYRFARKYRITPCLYVMQVANFRRKAKNEENVNS